MRVGFVCDRPAIFNGGYSQRIMREVGMVCDMDDVEVYMHTFISFKASKGVNVKKRVNEIYNPLGVKEHRFSVLISSKLAFVRNIYDAIYINEIEKFIHRYNLDIIICENLWSSYLGCVAAKKAGIQYIFDYHGVVPEETVFEGYCVYGDKKYRYLKRIERVALEGAKSIICVSNAFKKYLIKEYQISENQIMVVPSCINKTSLYYDEKVRNEIRTKLGIQNKKVLIYAGSIVKYQCVEEMIWLFSKLKKCNEDFYFVFLSAYNNFKEVEELFVKYNIESNDYLIKSVSHDEIQQYYCAADYGLIIRENHILNNVASPTKIVEYLSCGLPIIGTNCIGDICELESGVVLLDYERIIQKETGCIDEINKIDISAEARRDNFLRAKDYIEKTYLWECYKNGYYGIIME